MTVKIDKKIVNFNILKEDSGTQEQQAAQQEKQNVQTMSERIRRPETLAGETYKIKPPHAEHALYITINDIVLNEGTEYEMRRPFEIFLSSKDMGHYQWTIALTLIISAVFRKGGDVTFLVDELRSVFDPNGGYFKPGGKYIPSLVAEIGEVINKHLKKIGLIKEDDPGLAQHSLIAEKRQQAQENNDRNEAGQQQENSDFPAESQLCSTCNTKAMIMLDGCLTCLSCGYSKCG